MEEHAEESSVHKILKSSQRARRCKKIDRKPDSVDLLTFFCEPPEIGDK